MRLRLLLEQESRCDLRVGTMGSHESHDASGGAAGLLWDRESQKNGVDDGLHETGKATNVTLGVIFGGIVSALVGLLVGVGYNLSQVGRGHLGPNDRVGGSKPDQGVALGAGAGIGFAVGATVGIIIALD